MLPVLFLIFAAGTVGAQTAPPRQQQTTSCAFEAQGGCSAICSAAKANKVCVQGLCDDPLGEADPTAPLADCSQLQGELNAQHCACDLQCSATLSHCRPSVAAMLGAGWIRWPVLGALFAAGALLLTLGFRELKASFKILGFIWGAVAGAVLYLLLILGTGIKVDPVVLQLTFVALVLLAGGFTGELVASAQCRCCAMCGMGCCSGMAVYSLIVFSAVGATKLSSISSTPAAQLGLYPIVTSEKQLPNMIGNLV